MNIKEKIEEEYQEAKKLNDKWLDEGFNFEKCMELRSKYEEHINKYKFYKKLLKEMKKEDENDRQTILK